MKKYTIQEIEAALDIVREAIPGITIPKINYGTSIGGAAPETGATNGAIWGTNLLAIPDIVATLVTGILGSWNVTNLNLRSGSTDANSKMLLDPVNAIIRAGDTSGTYLSLDGYNKKLESSNYSAGSAGLHINPTLLDVPTINTRAIQIGAATGQTTTVTVVTDIRSNAGQMQKKTKTLTYTAGVLTSEGTESAWTNTTDI